MPVTLKPAVLISLLIILPLAACQGISQNLENKLAVESPKEKRDAIKQDLRLNMLSYQIALEAYAKENNGQYPLQLGNILDEYLPFANMVNPLDSQEKPIVVISEISTDKVSNLNENNRLEEYTKQLKAGQIAYIPVVNAQSLVVDYRLFAVDDRGAILKDAKNLAEYYMLEGYKLSEKSKTGPVI